MSTLKKKTLKKRSYFNSLLFHPYISKYMTSWLHQDYDNHFQKNDLVECEELQASIPNLQFRVHNFNSAKGILTLRFMLSPQDLVANKPILILNPKYQSKNNPTLPISLPISIKKIKNINYGFIQVPIIEWEKINPFYHFEIIDRPIIDQLYSQLQIKAINNFKSTGIIFLNNLGQTYHHLIKQLYQQLTHYYQQQPIIYHPGSNKQIIDIVHPSLYPLITKISKSTPKSLKPSPKSPKKNIPVTDFWNRPYEDSQYQMLPSEFYISKEGKCQITSYINNLPQEQTELYHSLEQLFEFALPQLEKVWSYIKTIRMYDNADVDLFNLKDNDCQITNIKDIKLRDRHLQVICKITQTNLHQSNLEGVWHVEGMSHEHIVASAIHVLHQDPQMSVNLSFRRRFTQCEASHLYMNSPQDRPPFLNQLLETNSHNHQKKDDRTGLVPLGQVSTQTGSLTVFPNSHIHQLKQYSSGSKTQSRMVVVFWLVNPDHPIVSTKDISPQQLDPKLPLKKALEHQLKFMTERKYHKSQFNIRDLNLCEH